MINTSTCHSVCASQPNGYFSHHLRNKAPKRICHQLLSTYVEGSVPGDNLFLPSFPRCKLYSARRGDTFCLLLHLWLTDNPEVLPKNRGTTIWDSYFAVRVQHCSVYFRLIQRLILREGETLDKLFILLLHLNEVAEEPGLDLQAREPNTSHIANYLQFAGILY